MARQVIPWLRDKALRLRQLAAVKRCVRDHGGHDMRGIGPRAMVCSRCKLAVRALSSPYEREA